MLDGVGFTLDVIGGKDFVCEAGWRYPKILAQPFVPVTDFFA